MKKTILFVLLLTIACLSISGCTGNNTVKNDIDYSYIIGDSPDLANAPSEEYIIECLEKSEYVLEIEAATPSNDPNGKLNQEGGYIACVYFSSQLIDQTVFSETSVIDKATSCGGCIEVYDNEADAVARNDYLSTFDGGLLDSGSHTVIGTIIIRTSEKLSNEQQIDLTLNLIQIITSSENSTSSTTEAPQETTPADSESTTEPITEPTTEATTEPAVSPATEPTAIPTTAPTSEPTVAPTTTPTTEPTAAPTTQPQPTEFTYVLNTHTMKFHYADCHSVDKIATDNIDYFTGTREELIAMGYSPCGNCDP